MDFPQAVVLGAGGDTYRRVDVAEDRAGAETQGDPAPMLLSPDGRYVAVGDHDTTEPDVAFVDLTTGKTSTYDLPQGRSVIPVAFSADGGSLAVLLSDEPTNPYRASGSRARRHPRPGESSTEVVDVDGRAPRPGVLPRRLRDRRRARVPPGAPLIALGDADGPGALAARRRPGRADRVVARRAPARDHHRRAASGAPGGDAPGTPTGLAFVDRDRFRPRSRTR